MPSDTTNIGEGWLLLFDYADRGAVNAVLEAVSQARLNRYLNATDGNPAAALQLYAWNAEVCSALYLPLQALEVGYRNALHRVLSQTFSPTWYENDKFTKVAGNDELLKTIGDARTPLAKRQADDPSHLVAELSFGFWTCFLEPRFEPSYWAMAIWRAFPHHARPLRRSEVADRFHHIRTFRNRIAHHEPIFHRDLKQDYRSILEACSWMYEHLAEWVDHHSVVCRVLERRPQFPSPDCHAAGSDRTIP
jgi:hypothetical protein